jgi:hypothetical protein
MVSHKDIKNERQWKSTVGMKEKDFFCLSKMFGETFEQEEGISIKERSENLKKEFIFPTYEEMLFFTLFTMRNPLVYETLGFVFGIDSGLSQKNFRRFLKILMKTLLNNGLLPKKEFVSLEEFIAYMSEQDEITIDVTEYSTQRPQNTNKQKEMYSGKKNDIQ